MGFNASALSSQTELNKENYKLAVKALSEAKLAKALQDSDNFQAGIQGRAPILKISNDVQFQSASCGRSALGSTILSEKFIDIAKIAIHEDICYDAVEQTYFGQLMKHSDEPTENVLNAEVTNKINEDKIAQIAINTEILLWQGDTSLTGATNNKYIDGVKKQLSSITATTVTGATIVEKLQAVYMAMPEADRTKEDAYIFLSEALFDEYKIALYQKNMFHETALGTLPGTSIKLFPTAGLNGQREVYATRLSNFRLGYTGTPEVTSIKFWYSEDDNIFKQSAFFSVGISVIFPELARRATV